MSKKSQIAIEYLIIISLIMLISIPSFALYQSQATKIKKEIQLNQASVALQNLVDSAESLFYLGPPSVETVTLYFPENINNISIKENEIIANLDIPVYVFSKVKLKGYLNAKYGIHRIKLSAKEENQTYYILIEDE